jgi:zinc protease
VREVLFEIDRMRESPVMPSELSLATSYLDGVFPIRFETTDAVATALANLVLFGLPGDYYDSYRANVRAVTAEHVLAAARTHLHPDRLHLVVVGDPDAVRTPLERMAVGPVTVWDDRGEPIA